MKLVDVSFLVDYASGDSHTIAYLATHEDEVIGASTIVLSAFYRGLVLTQDMTLEDAMSKYEWVEAVPCTNDTAAEAAEIYVELRENGQLLNTDDVYIARAVRFGCCSRRRR